MATKATSNSMATYEKIKEKIYALRHSDFPSLRSKTDDYIFSALCIKSDFYQNPSLELTDSDLEEILVDGQYDGGVDALLNDPTSDTSDLVIVQSKLYKTISMDDIMNALNKMVSFYQDITKEHYELLNEKVQRRFISLRSEMAEESKVHFVFYTSAPKPYRTSITTIERKFRNLFDDSSFIDISILFGDDIVSKIKEAESRRPSVEYGKISIDKVDNYLEYGNDAIIVNVSARSIRRLYAEHSIGLLSQNLRYHIKGGKAKTIDDDISSTIENDPSSFWMRNNGITIICDEFDIDGKEVKLWDFSIINGGQTTYLLHKSKHIGEDYPDFFLPCKIIKAIGETTEERSNFSLDIAKSTNSQKPIKPEDLKANMPEQVRFVHSMYEAGIQYITKRGESIKPAFKQPYKNSSLREIGKLCIAGIFQLPATSRNKPSTYTNPRYYDRIFNGNQTQIANLCKELLYIDHYFTDVFIKKFDAENRLMSDNIEFAHNARTVCVAFVAFAARYYQGNITDQDLQRISLSIKPQDKSIDSNLIYEIFSNLEGISHFFPNHIFDNKDQYDDLLNKLFDIIIRYGSSLFSMVKYMQNITASNYLKNDLSYFQIITSPQQIMICNEIQSVLNAVLKLG